MTYDEIRQSVLAILSDIAPELQPARIKPDKPLRDQLDLDSMDFLNFVIGLHKRFQLEIPESDYAKLATLEGCVAYLAAHGIG